MKAIWNGGGSPRNKLAALVLAVVFAFAIILPSNVAEAGANIHYNATNAYTQSGKVIVQGYFYNSGNTGGYVTALVLRGNAGGVEFGGSFSLNLYVAAGGRTDWNCSVSDGRIRSGGNVQVSSSTQFSN